MAGFFFFIVVLPPAVSTFIQHFVGEGENFPFASLCQLVKMAGHGRDMLSALCLKGVVV